MRELPILFSTPMVQAILDDRKSMTRRVVKGLPDDQSGCDLGIIKTSSGELTGYGFEEMPYQPGDRLWVRETWKCVKYDSMDGDLSYGVEFKDGARKYFEFDDNERYHQFGKFAFKEGWQPSIYLPREAARIWLEVTNVRVERLQEITEEDARAEGVAYFNPCATDVGQNAFDALAARAKFISLWDSLNAKRGYGWETNPWVWVISFKRVNKCH